MLGTQTQLLLSISSTALIAQNPSTLPDGTVAEELAELLSERNGFYAFQSALHVFGSGVSVPSKSLEDWNMSSGWRSAYKGMADRYLFFAEDAFGAQFAIRDDHVWAFDPETGNAVVMASSLEGWAEQLVSNYSVLTGSPVMQAWQHTNGPIMLGKRLIPKQPFILGGSFEASNVYALDSEEGMRLRADLALQIKHLPDGAKIRYRIVD